MQRLIDKIDQEYDRESGFLGQLRMGVFDEVGERRLLGLLASMDLGTGPIERRLVQLLWFMPIFIQWQKERFELNGGDAKRVEGTLNSVVSILEDVLGVP